MPPNTTSKVNSIGASTGPMDYDQLAMVEQQLKLINDFQTYENSNYGTVTLGHVYSSVPYTGIHAVILAGQGNTKVFAMTCYPGSNRINGMRSPQLYLPGTTVVMLVKGEKADKALPQYVIVGAIDILALEDSKKHIFDKPVEFFMRDGGFSLDRADTGFVLTNSKDPIQKANYSYGKPVDGLAGEYTMVNSLGNGIFANEFMCSLKGSERAKIETFLFDNSVRITADHYEIRNAMYENKIYFNGYGVAGSERVAQTFLEGIGALDGTSHTNTIAVPAPELKLGAIQPDSTAPRNGFFSYQKLHGTLADGKMELITIPPLKPTYLQDTTVAPGVLSIEATYDGTFRIKAAREISLEKTVYITAPKEMVPCDTDVVTKSLDRKEWDQEHDLLENEGVLAGKRFLDSYDTYNKDNSLTDMRQQDKNWLVPNKDLIFSSFNDATGGDFKADETIDPLGPQEPHYPAPAVKTFIKPYTKNGIRQGNFTVYNTSSGIRQLPDGSVVIYGGNGEEIRMYRGNIYLTCPGDIIQQPGRDSINMAPRNNIVKAGTGTLELSSQNTASMVTNGNLQICACASGMSPGTLLIENKAPTDFIITAFQEGGMDTNTSKGGGIIFKSASRIMSISPYAYVGCGSKSAESLFELDYETTEFHSDNHKHYIENLYTLMGRAGTAMSMGSNLIEFLSPNIYSGTSNFSIISTKKKIPYYDRTGKAIPVSITTGAPLTTMLGGLLVASSLECGGITTPGGNPPGDNTKYHPDNVRRIPTEANNNTSRNIKHTYGVSSILENMKVGMSALSQIGTILPSTEAYKANNFYFPLSTWQAILTGGSMWREMVISGNTGPTMTFPGRDRWTADGSIREFDVTSESMKDLVLSGNYTVNV